MTLSINLSFLVLIICNIVSVRESKPPRPLPNNIPRILIPIPGVERFNSNEDTTRNGLEVLRNNKLRIGMHLLLAFLLVGIAWIGNVLIRWDAIRRSKNWLTDLKHAEVKQSPGPTDPAVSILSPLQSEQSEQTEQSEIAISKEQHKRLSKQLEDTQNYARYHMKLLQFFYAYYYMSILLFTTSGFVAAIALVMISKRGWDQSNEYLITTFFVMTAITVFYKSIPKAFGHIQNIADNKILYLKYISLENEILSYAVTGEPMNETQRESSYTAKDFIHYVDQQLAENNIAIGLDDANAPTIQTVLATLK